MGKSVQAIFESMKKSASALLRGVEDGEYTQAIVLLTANENEYAYVIKNALSEEKADETALLERLKNADDTDVRYALCVWQNGGIDLPSFAFRKMLRELNCGNSEALIFVLTSDGIAAKKLSLTTCF